MSLRFFNCFHLCSEEASGKILWSDADTKQMLLGLDWFQMCVFMRNMRLGSHWHLGRCWWFHGGAVSLLVTGPKMALPVSSSFCQSSSWFCNANEVHGFTRGLPVLMTKPLQVWGREMLRNFLLWKGILFLGWFESQFMASGQRQLLLLLPN